MSLQEETTLSQQLTQQADEDDYDATALHDDSDEGDTAETRARERYQSQRGNIFNRFLPIYQNIVKEAGTSFAAFQELERRLPDLERTCKEASRKEEEERLGRPIDTSMGLPKDKSTSNARKKPFCSPKRRQKARNGKATDSPDGDGAGDASSADRYTV